MSRITPLLLFALFYGAIANGQGWQWGKGSVGNNVTAWPVATDTSGNEYVAGVSSGPVSFDNYNPLFTTTNNFCVLAKYNSQGDFLWARNTQNSINASLINITTDVWGNCYLLGWLPDSVIEIGSFTLHNTIYPDAQYFIAKYDPWGNVTWAKNAGGRSGSLSVPPVVFSSVYAAKMMGLGAISSDAGGNIYVTTGFNLPTVTAGSYTLTNTNTPGGTDDIMLVKYDSSGSIIWAKSSGGSGEDIPCSLTVTPVGAIYIAGMFNSDSIVFGPSVITDTSMGTQKWNAFIARYDASGNPVWANSSGGNGKVYAAGVAADANNNVYLTGGSAESSISFGGANITDSTPGTPVLYLVQFDTLNNAGWYQTIGSPTGGAAWGYGVATSPGGRVWVAGAFSDEVNISGNLLDTPAGSVNPIFIAGFDVGYGYYIASAALQSGSDKQAGIACDANGSVYLCSDYKYPCIPFIIADDVLADVMANETWLYLAKYDFPGGSGESGGPSTAYLSENIEICPQDSISLTAPRGYAIYRWNDGTTDTLLRATLGTYWVKATGDGNSAIVDTFHVMANSALCNCNVFLPDAFTPNEDGENDVYRPVFAPGCSVTRYAFSIYNRWGQRVFYSENPYAAWDGRFNGANADMDVYMFYLIYSTNPNYPEHVRKGDVTLVR